MKKNYCLPIIKNKKNEILKIIHANITGYSYFEVWLDYVDDLDNSFIKQLIKLLKGKLILLFRRQNLEKVKMDLSKRLKIIDFLENSQSFIDLDIFDQKEELAHLKNALLKVKVIASYHDYKKTPETEKLKEIIDIMNKYKPAVYKISTMCNTQKDTLKLLQSLLDLRKRNLKYIILGMGKIGTITRIFGTLWGNEMIFAPRTTTGQSAPGQLTRNELETIFKKLKE